MTIESEDISVSICTYNGARFLAKQLESILSQTLPPREVIVRDDGSTDETLRVIEGFGDKLTLLSAGDRLGVTHNFERAMSACRGRYIALSDQDDIWAPNKLELLYDAFQRDSTLRLVGSNAAAIDENDDPMGFDLFGAIALSATERGAVANGAAFDALLKRSLFTGATVMLRADLLSSARPFPSKWLHDEWLAIIAAATGNVQLLPDKLTSYRQHGTNVAGVQENTALRRLSKAAKLIAPRTERYKTLLARRRSLLERLEDIGAPASAIDKARAALAHEEFRTTLPTGRLMRLVPILRERRAGLYDSVDYGDREVLRDLLASSQ